MQTSSSCIETVAPTHYRVLIVGDDAHVRDGLREILEWGGHDVMTAADGSEALARLREAPVPSLILLDLDMPGTSYQPFYAAQREDPALALVPVVTISSVDVRELATSSQIVACLRKPIHVGQLMDLIACCRKIDDAVTPR